VSLILLDRPDDITSAGRRDGHNQDSSLAGAAVPAPATSAGRPADMSPPASRVLVVDDTASIRTEIRYLLEDAGLNVVGEASHGAEGVMLTRELRPDVVVMDVRMPILDGIAATGYITRELPDTRVIVFSAFDDQELEDAARAAGASRFLTKGASPGAIAAAVRDATSA
jgi:DNA-binding NarL/FixJ family response regulator